MLKKQDIKKGVKLAFSHTTKIYEVIRINRLTITLQEVGWVGSYRVPKANVLNFARIVKD